MREPCGGNHLGIGKISAAFKAKPPKRSVGKAGKRSEDKFHFASVRGTSAGS